MSLMKRLAGGAAGAALAFTAAYVAQAQVTTADLRGVVRDPSGAPVAGASVTIIHTPTNSATEARTGANGVFAASGLRIGGPYTITASAPGAAKELRDVSLKLGEVYQANIQLEAVERETIVVTASAIGAGELASGPSSRFTLSDVENFSSINRDFKEVVQRDPLAYIDFQSSGLVELRIAGTNPRFNSINVDGIRQNDNFGLNNQGYPTARSPLVIDFVEQVNVETAPFDVEYSGFTGGNINAVTKSGTNEFHGTGYYFYKDDSLVGDKIDGNKVPVGVFEDKAYGFTVGGPILKDRLFFFGGYEEIERIAPLGFGVIGSGFDNIKIPQAELDEVLDISRTVYGFDPLDPLTVNEEPGKRILGKLDWNITNDHRANFTYQFADGSTLSTRSSTSTSLPIYGTPSNWYNDAETLESYVLQVFSDWSDRLSTEVRVGYLDLEGDQAPLNGADFPEIYVATTPIDGGGSGYVVVGPDQFRHANFLAYDTLTIKAKADYELGAHLITGGYEREDSGLFNLFVEGSDGIYRFDSVEDFRDGILSTTLDNRLRSGRGREPIRLSAGRNQDGTLDVNAAGASFDIGSDSLYIQDQWSVLDNLTLVGGLRYERLSASENIPLNQAFLDKYGFPNTGTVDGLDILLPRFAFNYALSEDITVRGGFGRFSGGNPNVWISNNYSNNGVSLVQVQGTPDQLGLDPGFLAGRDLNEEPAELLSFLSAGNASGAVNALDPSFTIPSTWRASVGLDANIDLGGLGEDYRAFVSVLFARAVDSLYYYDPSATVIGQTFDGRNRYGNTSSDLVLANADKDAESRYVSFGLGKDFDKKGVSFDVSYTNSRAEEISPLTSSTASSNQVNRAWINFNEPEVGRSAYDRKHLIDAYFEYEKAFFGDFFTKIGLFGQYQSGRPFSYTFGSTNWGEPSGGRALMYVPTGPNDPRVVFSGIDTTAFFDYLDSTGLSDFAGGIAPRNEFFGPWYSRWDLRITQELPGALRGHKTELSLDIFNIGNLINDEWGKLAGPGFPQTVSVVRAAYDPVTDRYTYTNFTPQGSFSPQNPQSQWQVQFGLRYKF